MIDLRSDICAQPTEEMWEAMRAADLGWASIGEDENVRELERRGAALLGKETCVLVPTCTAANVAAVLAQTEPGDRVLVDDDAHIAVSESGWLEPLARVQRGEPAAVVCLENTQTRRGGTVLTVARTEELAARAPRAHLDGARLANAAVALGVPIADLAAPADTVSFSLNKGLSAPAGALLAGDAETIDRARLHLRRIGAATMHKAGIYAAAGLLALELVDRLGEDHRRARELARLIGAAEPETNIVYADIDPAALRERGVLAFEVEGRSRFVTHRLITDEDVARAAEVVHRATSPRRPV